MKPTLTVDYTECCHEVYESSVVSILFFLFKKFIFNSIHYNYVVVTASASGIQTKSSIPRVTFSTSQILSNSMVTAYSHFRATCHYAEARFYSTENSVEVLPYSFFEIS